MKRISIHNPGKMAIYVGAEMIPAGETRDFPEDQVPAHLRPVEPPVPAKAQGEYSPPGRVHHVPPASAEKRKAELAELLKKNVGDVEKKFSKLSDEDLTALEALEYESDSPRKSLLEAIAAEQLQRAGGG